MSVAQHLKIQLSEYDESIRTFIPNYEELLQNVAELLVLVRKPRPTIVDLGIGTGALALLCLQKAPQARLIGLDADAAMLAPARRRLARKLNPQSQLVHGNFLDTGLPRCDALVSTLALHHLRPAKAKQRFYAKCFAALRRGGMLINGDCCPAGNRPFAQQGMERWRAHVRRFYNARRTNAFFAAWAKEDRYFSLQDEVRMLAAAGFETEVVWRHIPFAVLVGYKK